MEVILALSLCFSPHKYSRRADLADFLPQPCWEQVHWNVGVVCHLEGRVAITARDQRTFRTDRQYWKKKITINGELQLEIGLDIQQKLRIFGKAAF